MKNLSMTDIKIILNKESQTITANFSDNLLMNFPAWVELEKSLKHVSQGQLITDKLSKEIQYFAYYKILSFLNNKKAILIDLDEDAEPDSFHFKTDGISI